VDAKLATDVGVRLESKLDPSLLIASATLAPGASLDRVEAVLDRVVETLKRAVPPKSELARAHQQVRAWARYEQDGVTFQGMLLSAGEGLGAWDFAETLLAKVEKVRPEQVRAAARRYLVDEHRTVVRFHAQEVPG
jgi:zinc protease